jgi:parallel beta-helix repeat protein
MRISALLIILGICSFGFLSAEIINVPDEYPTIQEGIDEATDGDTVLVEQGTYLENVNFRGKGILLTSNFTFSSDSLDIYNTIIEGGYHAHPDTGSCVLFVSGESQDAKLSGFTLENGLGTYGPGLRDFGGGVFINESNPAIISNIIKNNGSFGVSPSVGGGIGILGQCRPYIMKNIIADNYSGHGGGIGSILSEGIIIGNMITSNGCVAYGGGIGQFYSNLTVERNLIIHNEASDFHMRGWGGGIYIQHCVSSLIRNNTIYDNLAYNVGGGIYIFGSSSMVIENNIVMLNEPWGIRCLDYSVTLLYNDFWSNIPVDYSGIPPGEFDISEDPLFVDAGNDNFHLLPDSPCIDAGNPATPNIPWGGFRRDIGALEYDQGFYFDGQNLIRKPVPIEFPIPR